MHESQCPRCLYSRGFKKHGDIKEGKNWRGQESNLFGFQTGCDNAEPREGRWLGITISIPVASRNPHWREPTSPAYRVVVWYVQPSFSFLPSHSAPNPPVSLQSNPRTRFDPAVVNLHVVSHHPQAPSTLQFVAPLPSLFFQVGSPSAMHKRRPLRRTTCGERHGIGCHGICVNTTQTEIANK